MAGDTLYIGNLFKSMIDKLTDLVARMELVNVSISRSIQSTYVKPGATKFIWHPIADITNVNVAYSTINKFHCQADGVITCKGTLKSSNVS